LLFDGILPDGLDSFSACDFGGHLDLLALQEAVKLGKQDWHALDDILGS
jgi:hypothetical protein